MASAVRLRTDFTAGELRQLAKKAKHVNQSRRLLSLAAVIDGISRTEAAMIGGMDRQTLRDWVHRFNAAGPDGLLDNWASRPVPRLWAVKKASSPGSSNQALTGKSTGWSVGGALILFDVTAQRFGVDYCERYVGTLLRELGFSHISARPRHPAQDAETIEAYKKTLPTR